MHIDILTLFPEMFESPLAHSIVKRAIERKKLTIDFIDFREFSQDKHKQVDDYPFGGAPGMVIKPEPLFEAVDFLKEQRKDLLGSEDFPLIYLTPQGETYTQKIAEELCEKKYLAILCGHYKDVDYRVREHLVTREISIGNYVLSGGELPAMIIIDSLARLQEGVLTNIESAYSDSFQGNTLDGPYYTRPREYRGYKVPDVLLSGNHKMIEEWQKSKRKKLSEKVKGASDV